jgi:hypothetical protein
VVDRATRGAVAVSAGTASALVGTFLPWLRSGARNRSSYSIFDLVERLGFAPDGFVAWSLRLWPLVPLVLVACTVAAWAVVTRHLDWRVAAVALGVSVVWVGSTAVALLFAPEAGLFRIGHGPAVTAAGIALTAAGAVWLRPRRSAASGAA